MTTELDEMKFGEAMSELEAIVSSIETDEVDLDDLADRVDRAAALVQLCRERIANTEMRVKKIIDGLEDEDSP
jgi:exodeoxyribonuclease VII small subunit